MSRAGGPGPCFLEGMKTALFSLAAASLLVLVGCADGSPVTGKKDDRIGGSVGVAVTSRDMSRVVPARPDFAPAKN